MTDNLLKWIQINKLTVSEVIENDLDIINIDGVGKFLYLKPFDGKIINEDFTFEVSDTEFDCLQNREVDYILFEFGEKFYYSAIQEDRNRYNEIIYKPEFNDFKYLGKINEPFIAEFAHLGIHTEYELLNGSGDCELWATKGKFLNCKALGICDKNTLAGTLAFQTACLNKGIQFIIGETISVARNYSPEKQNQEIFDLKLYVLNNTGWQNLLLINKMINVDYEGFIPDNVLSNLGKGLCCVIPKESEFNHEIKNKRKALQLIKQYKTAFDDVYYQIDTLEYTSQQLFKRHLENLDEYIGFYKKFLKPITINDSYYLDKEQCELKTLLNKISKKANPESKDQYFKTVEQTLNSYQEWILDVEPLFNTIMAGIMNTIVFSKKVKFKINTGDRKLPKFKVKDVEGLFFEQLEIGINERLKHVPPKQLAKYLDRIETECSVIVPNGLCDYFMILWDVVKWGRENDINVGPGRGSVCGSLVAYCLYITDVDPIKYNLLFERFLNEARVSGERAKSSDSLPDIDIDFPAEYRDIVKEYIKNRYGYNHTCVIGSFTRMKLKTCLKDFAKEEGLSFSYTNRLTKDINDQIEYTWGDLFKYANQSKTLYKFVQEYPDLVHNIKYALQMPKAQSIHPSAIVIVPDKDEKGNEMNVWDWLPVKLVDGMLVSEWEGKYIDKSGFLKEDILGLSQLDKFKNILKLIKENLNEQIILNDIPLDDEEVFKYFRRGWNEDVFQFGTAGMMNYCRQVKPDNIEHLIAMTALFRPGPMDVNAHETFADIKNSKKRLSFDFGMEEITKDTYGLYIYQEQIMKAVVIGGLTEVEADILRTTIKKKDAATLSSYGEKFKSGYITLLKQNGIERAEEYAESVWQKLLAFSGYGFNRSHAAAYSIMSYWSQWFKVNYPLEFWTTSLQFSSEAEIPYRLAEIKKTGVEIEIRPPDINFSDINFTCDVKNQRIFFSLLKIKGVGEVAVRNIIETRQSGGKFFSLEEFVSRVPSKVNKSVIRCLIVAGAFDLIENIKNPRDRKRLLEEYYESRGETIDEEYQVEDSTTNAFWILQQKALTGFGEIDYETMIRDAIPNKTIAKKYVNDSEFLIAKLGTEVTIAGKLIYYREKEIKTGTMCTLNIDCNNTIIPVLLWPDAYERIENVAELKGCTVAINGIVEKDKFKNERKLKSTFATRLYIISDYKTKTTRYEEWRNSRQ